MKRIRKLILHMSLLLTIAMFMPAQVNAAVKLNKKSVTLTVGQNISLKLKGTKKKVKWSSSKKAVATVNSKGKVKAKKKGKATIKAKVDNKTYKCKVIVEELQPIVSEPTPAPILSENSININIGEQKSLGVKNGTGNIIWNSSDYSIADITSSGTVIGKGYGKCIITATVDNTVLQCLVNVNISDPECFPSQTTKIGKATINSFEAKFISYQLYNDYSKEIDNDTYFFPYTYRIKITGKTEPNSRICIRFCLLRNKCFPDMPGNNYVICQSDSNGNFVVDQNVKFSTYGEMIYIASI